MFHSREQFLPRSESSRYMVRMLPPTAAIVALLVRFFSVSKAQVNVLCLNWALAFKLHPSRKPYGRRSGRNAGKQSCLRGGPQCEQPGQRVAAQNDPDVFRQYKLLFQGGITCSVRKRSVSAALPPKLLCPSPQELPTEKVHRSSFSPGQRQTETNAPNLCNGGTSLSICCNSCSSAI